MKAIAMFNNKCGVGKTTLTCNLAAYFAREELNDSLEELVLLVDDERTRIATEMDW